MADRRKQLKKRGKDKNGSEAEPTKEEKAVATYVRFNCATKTTMCAGDDVHYFAASKAVDCLMESKWAAAQCKKAEPLFTNRHSCALYMQNLLDKGLFWRARKLVPRVVEREKVKGGGGDTNDETKATGSPKKRKRDKVPEEASGSAPANEDESVDTKDKDKEDTAADEKLVKDDDKKKKKKVKLEFHSEQVFKDGNDVYVWHFDPVSWTKYLIGLGLVIGSIVMCLFPLWPHWMRLGVYYLSLCAMGFVGVLLLLIVLRGIVFACVWSATMGQHHFWILPNLTEDCGFLESFQPSYSHEFIPKSDEKKKKKGKKEKESDVENDNEESDNAKDAADQDTGDESDDNGDQQCTDTDRRSTGDEAPGEGTGADSSAQNTPRHRRADNDTTTANDTNGFEIVG